MKRKCTYCHRLRKNENLPGNSVISKKLSICRNIASWSSKTFSNLHKRFNSFSSVQSVKDCRHFKIFSVTTLIFSSTTCLLERSISFNFSDILLFCPEWNMTLIENQGNNGWFPKFDLDRFSGKSRATPNPKSRTI